jgi:uncharacterized protein (UPF0335 family)
LNRWIDARRNYQYFVSKTAECLEQEINLRIKDTVKPNEQTTKCQALQVKLVVENWRLKRAAKGEDAENQKIFEKLLAFLN